MTDQPIMPALYAAIEAVHEGKIAECEIEHRVMLEPSDGQPDREELLTITVRRSVKLIKPGGGEVEADG